MTSMRIDGVDISHWQSGEINYATAKAAGVRFVYHKSTEGNSYADPNYEKRRAEAKTAGIPFGAYHFARASAVAADGAAEARYMLSVAKPVPGDLSPALDLETMEGLNLTQVRAWAKEFIAEVKKSVGVLPVVYTPFDLGVVDDGCVIWRPRYNNQNNPPLLRWDIWQFSNGVVGVPNNVAGFGHVDLNTMRDGLRMRDIKIPLPAVEPEPVVPSVNLVKLIKAAKTDPKAAQGHQTYPKGVKIVENALLKEGLLNKKYAKDGSYGSTTVAAYAAWQKRLGYRGSDADGIPGKTSLKKLGKKYGFTVK